MSKPRNVLFITPDQWRADCLSTLGHPTIKTPNFDALAADGVLFRNHFAQCSPCGPSRTSLLTGMYMMNTRSVRNGTPLDARFTNIALELRGAGYDPAVIGYTDTSVDPRLYGPDDPALTNGYEDLLPGFRPIALLPTDPVVWVEYLRELGYDVPERPFDVFKPKDGHEALGGFGPFDAPAIYRAEHSDTAFCTDLAIDHIAREGGTPWFLHLVYLKPHPPYIVPEPYNRMYDPAGGPPFRRAASPEEEAAQHPFLAARVHGPRGVGDMDEADQRQLRATYYGMITEVDDNIGRLVAFLKESGRYDDTLIVVTSDHGDMLGDHWMTSKEIYFDQTFHVPLIVRAPGAAMDAGRGRVVEAFTENVDLMPTFLDALGLDVPAQCDGASLMPFLDGGAPARWRDAAHWEYDFRDVADASLENHLDIAFDECHLAVIRDARYKYVHFAALPPLFFDIANDPDERNDLAGDPAHAATMLGYAQRMLSWRMANVERTLTGILLTPEGPIELDRPRR